jgi:hypothetical protein
VALSEALAQSTYSKKIEKELSMNSIKLKGAVPLIVLELVLLVSPSVAQDEVTKEQLDAVGAQLEAPKAFYHNLSAEQRNMLSGAALNFFHVVDQWPNLERQVLLGQLSPLADSSSSSEPSEVDIATTLAPVAVSNPATDFKYSLSSGFTESETSTAWCGSNVVVGFNDSGSYWESGFATSFKNISLDGFSSSGNQGLSFTDHTYLPAATVNPFNFLLGDPVVACTSGSTFYYASLLATVNASGAPLTAATLSKSTTAGSSFGAPVIAVSKSAFTHFLDKDWMAVNPANTSQIAVTYTDFDFSGTSSCGSRVSRTGIELVASFNGGATWSSPQVIYTACGVAPNFPSVQGSQVAFSPSGAVNVAFELYSRGVPTGRQIEFKRAPSLGAPFGPTVAVQNVTAVGDGFALQGGFRAFLDIGTMAVDHSASSVSKGYIYIVYHDATDFVKKFSGVPYGYADVKITKSTNNGTTWSAPVEVNTNTEPLTSGLGIDSYMPGVAVDNTSKSTTSPAEVGVCWYDRRNDAINLKVDRFCGDSFDAGSTFTNVRMTTASFSPIHATDDLINGFYMGDYDTVASDSLELTSGFIGAFQVVKGAGGTTLVPNSDVVARNFN